MEANQKTTWTYIAGLTPLKSYSPMHDIAPYDITVRASTNANDCLAKLLLTQTDVSYPSDTLVSNMSKKTAAAEFLAYQIGSGTSKWKSG